MAKLSAVCLIFFTVGCAWCYYYQSYPHHPPQNVIYRHHFPAYHPPTPYINPAPLVPAYQPSYSAHPPLPAHPKAPANYMFPSPSQASPHHVPYNSAPYQSNYYSPPRNNHPPSRGQSYAPYTSYHSHSNYAPKQAFFSRIKPFLFGHTSPKSLPHHPFYPNHHHPHHYTPNRGFHNQQPHHHAHHHQHHQMPHMHHVHDMHQQHSCSCSLHVGHLTVYKHIDMRASYSCHDLKDCKSFCTNLFSSEDLRAQTRADACLLIGKDGSVPWFRRDQVCGHHGLHNDTKLSVDLCCKDLQPC